MTDTPVVRRLPDTIYIARGSHDPGDPTAGDPACTMEWAAWLAGEPWTDHPECTHPVIGAAVRAVTDQLDDKPRQQLAELIPHLVGTADDRGDPLARQVLSVRLAVWCAEQALHLGPVGDRTEAVHATVAARAWADDPCDRTREAAREAAAYVAAGNAATYAGVAAAVAAGASSVGAGVHTGARAAIYAANAHTANDDNPVGFLRGLLAEHTRLTTAEETL